LDYVNQKTEGPSRPDCDRPYPIQLPVPKIIEIARVGISRPHPPGRKLGYGPPELTASRTPRTEALDHPVCRCH
jgi:hypothetical protein